MKDIKEILGLIVLVYAVSVCVAFVNGEVTVTEFIELMGLVIGPLFLVIVFQMYVDAKNLNKAIDHVEADVNSGNTIPLHSDHVHIRPFGDVSERTIDTDRIEKWREDIEKMEYPRQESNGKFKGTEGKTYPGDVEEPPHVMTEEEVQEKIDKLKPPKLEVVHQDEVDLIEDFKDPDGDDLRAEQVEERLEVESGNEPVINPKPENTKLEHVSLTQTPPEPTNVSWEEVQMKQRDALKGLGYVPQFINQPDEIDFWEGVDEDGVDRVAILTDHEDKSMQVWAFTPDGGVYEYQEIR